MPKHSAAEVRPKTEMVKKIIKHHFGKAPKKIQFKPAGLTNFVFEVNSSEGEFIVRIARAGAKTKTAPTGTSAIGAGTGTETRTAETTTAAIRAGAGTETKKAAARSAIAVVMPIFIHRGGVMDRSAMSAKVVSRFAKL